MEMKSGTGKAWRLPGLMAMAAFDPLRSLCPAQFNIIERRAPNQVSKSG